MKARHLRDAATICPAVLPVPGSPLRCELNAGHDGWHKQECTHWRDNTRARAAHGEAEETPDGA